MTAMELQQWKKNFIEEYLNEIDSLEVMGKLEKYTKRILDKKEKKLPCVILSKEERIKTVRKATAQIEKGDYITDEELSKEMK